MLHELKISPEYFDAVAQGVKPFEVRKNDRDFKVGDVLCLCEGDKDNDRIVTGTHYSGYSGRKTRKVITYILDAPDYVKEGYVILGLAPAKDYDEMY